MEIEKTKIEKMGENSLIEQNVQNTIVNTIETPQENQSPDTASEAKKKEFRLSSKTLFLTYPRTNLTPKEALDQLKIILGVWMIKSYLICSEKHTEESSNNIENHIHAYIITKKRTEIKNPKKMHLIENGLEIKGNYQAARNGKKITDYILKDVFDTTDESKIIFSKDLSERMTLEGILENYELTMIRLAKKGNVAAAMKVLEDCNPMTYMKSHMAIEQSLMKLYAKERGLQAKFKLSEFELPAEMQKAFFQEKLGGKTKAIVGFPGTGKTQFIKSYLKEFGRIHPLIVTHLDGLRNFSELLHKAIIFDDCFFLSEGGNRERIIKLLDSEDEADIRVLHGSVRIPQNTPRFLLTNRSLQDLLGVFASDSAVTRRIEVFDIGQKSLFYLREKDETRESPEGILKPVIPCGDLSEGASIPGQAITVIPWGDL